ncbi:MAG: GTPase Era, partial [Bryobacteraceae bacterium]|nr:GTPase Era [Bryobacteraceae bacterium]
GLRARGRGARAPGVCAAGNSLGPGPLRLHAATAAARLTRPEAQVIFIDTPGIHKPRHKLGSYMVKVAQATFQEVDAILFVIDASRGFLEQEQEILKMIEHVKTPVFLLINKVDAVPREQILPLIETCKDVYAFREIVPISALQGNNVATLLEQIIKYLPEGPQYYPADQVTDHPEQFVCAELIREKILHETRQEVPHAVAVIVDRWEETPKLTRISATIYVEREGQKGIVIGAQGSRLKKIGTLAREEMELLFGRKIFLELYVKVRPKWRENPAFLNALDWRSMAGFEVS